MISTTRMGRRPVLRSVRFRAKSDFGVALLIGAIVVAAPAGAQKLPPGGSTAWEIRGVEEIVTFLLFDPVASEVQLPEGLRFIPAREAKMPEVQEHLERHPDHAEWAFSIIEIIRDTGFVLDGRSPSRPLNGATGLWIAPVDPSGFVTSIGERRFGVIAPTYGSVIALGVWIPDREFVAYMRTRGHYAEYGWATLTSDSTGVLQGEIVTGDFSVRAEVKPQSDFQDDPDEPGTQLVFQPGETVETVLVLGGAKARHRDCDGAWSKSGRHPLAHGVFVGPTYVTTYRAPLVGSAYHVNEAKQ